MLSKQEASGKSQSCSTWSNTLKMAPLRGNFHFGWPIKIWSLWKNWQGKKPFSLCSFASSFPVQLLTLFTVTFKGLGSWFRSLGAFYEGSQVILRSNKNKNLQASSFVISLCIHIFRTRRKRAFSLHGIIRVNYARRRLVYEANL